jgi:hypothetical protein
MLHACSLAKHKFSSSLSGGNKHENVTGLQTGHISRRISKEFITTRTKRKNVRNKYLVSYHKGGKEEINQSKIEIGSSN